MSEWFIQAVNYIGDKLWYDYSRWILFLYEDNKQARTRAIEEEFFPNLALTYFYGLLIALIFTAICIGVYKTKYNKKLANITIAKIFFNISFIYLLKWEILLLSPLFLISWCIAYIVYQDNRKILEKVNRGTFFLYAFSLFYLFIFIPGRVS